MPGQQRASSNKPEKRRRPTDSSAELSKQVKSALEDMKALDIAMLDVRHLTTITDTMFVASGRSDRHVRAVAEAVVERCGEIGVRPLGVEGLDAGEWVLIDLADVIVHVMLPRTREFYEIEKLWDISRPVGDT